MFKYSTNPQITPDLSKDKAATYSRGWVSKTASFDKTVLTDIIRTQAYCPSYFSDGHKVKDSVTEVHNIILDFDKGDPTYDEMLEKIKYWNFSAVLHTTRSHQTQQPPAIKIDKFRVIIPLANPISRLDLEYLKLRTDILDKFGKNIDPSTFDSNRFFAAAPNADVYVHEVRKTNSPTEIQFLDFSALNVSPAIQKTPGRPPKLFKEIIAQDNEVLTSTKNKKYFSHTLFIKLKNLTQVKVSSIETKSEIFCPFCDPKARSNPNSANAFIDINPAGIYYIYCSSESMTYWQEPTELDVTRSVLFWSSTMGKPVRVMNQDEADRRVNNTGSRIEIFKNDKDFENYCAQSKIQEHIEKYLPRREVIFDPTITAGLSPLYYNLFEASEYSRIDFEDAPVQELGNIIKFLSRHAPTIYAVFYNIFGDEVYITQFVNWLATILRSDNRKTATAWLITSETQGIGKDLIFKRILSPIFGPSQCQLLRGTSIGSRFNGTDQTCWLRGYNEVFAASDAKENSHRKEWLKNAITDDRQQIELKGKDDYSVKNFMNFILFSNNDTAIFLDKEDRRFSVVRNLKAKKIADTKLFKSLKQRGFEQLIEAELLEFSKLLYTLDYDELQANTALDTDAKRSLIHATVDEFELFAQALKTGDADYFQLDEVFPISRVNAPFAEHKTGDGIVLSEIAYGVYEDISHHKHIKGRYFTDISKKIFPNFTTKLVKRRLRLKKVLDVIEDNMRVYKYME